MQNIWVPIFIALFGNAVAVLIVLLTNKQTINREEARQKQEDIRLEKMQEDTRTQRQQEERWRVIDLQKDYYVSLYQELRAASLAVHNAGYGLGPQLEFSWNLPAFEALLRLRVFASESAYDAAEEAYTALWLWGDSGPTDYESKEEITYSSALRDYVVAVRRDLGIEVAE